MNGVLAVWSNELTLLMAIVSRQLSGLVPSTKSLTIFKRVQVRGTLYSPRSHPNLGSWSFSKYSINLHTRPGFFCSHWFRKLFHWLSHIAALLGQPWCKWLTGRLNHPTQKPIDVETMIRAEYILTLWCARVYWRFAIWHKWIRGLSSRSVLVGKLYVSAG